MTDQPTARYNGQIVTLVWVSTGKKAAGVRFGKQTQVVVVLTSKLRRI